MQVYESESQAQLQEKLLTFINTNNKGYTKFFMCAMHNILHAT
jgi:hypothetical protein